MAAAPGGFRLVSDPSRGPAVHGSRLSTRLWRADGAERFQMLKSDMGTVALESCLHFTNLQNVGGRKKGPRPSQGCSQP